MNGHRANIYHTHDHDILTVPSLKVPVHGLLFRHGYRPRIIIVLKRNCTCMPFVNCVLYRKTNGLFPSFGGQWSHIEIFGSHVVVDNASHPARGMDNKKIFYIVRQDKFPPKRESSFIEFRKTFPFLFVWFQSIASVIRINKTKCIGMPIIVSKTLRKISEFGDRRTML